MEEIRTISFATEKEKKMREHISSLLRNSPIPDIELTSNLFLYVNRQTLARALFICEIYHVNGVVMEFGVRWGQNLALFSSLRGIYEPFNYTQKIIGFDTFAGFPVIHEKTEMNQNKETIVCLMAMRTI